MLWLEIKNYQYRFDSELYIENTLTVTLKGFWNWWRTNPNLDTGIESTQVDSGDCYTTCIHLIEYSRKLISSDCDETEYMTIMIQKLSEVLDPLKVVATEIWNTLMAKFWCKELINFREWKKRTLLNKIIIDGLILKLRKDTSLVIKDENIKELSEWIKKIFYSLTQWGEYIEIKNRFQIAIDAITPWSNYYWELCKLATTKKIETIQDGIWALLTSILKR